MYRSFCIFCWHGYDSNPKIIELLISYKYIEENDFISLATFELELKAGTRTNKITSIHSEIALALAAKDVRIQAPIPGKNTVGIEIPNKVNSMVSFREIITSIKPTNKLEIAFSLSPTQIAQQYEL